VIGSVDIDIDVAATIVALMALVSSAGHIIWVLSRRNRPRR
jgi:hypothetical protein